MHVSEGVGHNETGALPKSGVRRGAEQPNKCQMDTHQFCVSHLEDLHTSFTDKCKQPCLLCYRLTVPEKCELRSLNAIIPDSFRLITHAVRCLDINRSGRLAIESG